jgi:hypothetical protein
MFSLWRVCVFERESHTNPRWFTQVRAPSAAMAVICAMTHYQQTIGKITVESFDGHGLATGDWGDE